MSAADIVKEALRTRLQAVPDRPGVYIMKDATGAVIYVGKAKVLRNRLRTYFMSKRLDEKTIQLVRAIRDFDYLVTDTEREALALEVTLIKRHRPKYNVVFKDDKGLPYLKVTVKERYPRVVRARETNDPDSRYFGPYTFAGSAARTLALIQQHFRLCYKEEEPITGKQERPCLPYYLGRCLGACAGKADDEEYQAATREVLLFLEGKYDQLLQRLAAARDEAAAELRFERAAYFRDRVRAVEEVVQFLNQRQKVVLQRPIDAHVVALAVEEKDACAEVLFIQQGRLVGHEHYILKQIEGESPESLQQQFVEQFYTQPGVAPQLLLLQYALLDPGPVEEMLRERRRGAVRIEVPRRGDKKALVEMARQNAKEGLEQERFRWLSDEQKRTGALLELQQVLGLDARPQRLECFDVSNIQGTSAVASMVVFEGGGPARKEYRRFQIRTVEGPNDFEMMREALSRRFKRASAESDGSSWTHLPDLLIVDGGKGQLGVAVEVLEAAGLSHIPVIGLAKQHEEIFVRGRRDSILLPRTSEALYLLQRIRDEAHRFAVTYHRNVRSKKATHSMLDDVRGVGPKRKQALIRAFGSVSALRHATVEDIAAVHGIDRATAERIKGAI